MADEPTDTTSDETQGAATAPEQQPDDLGDSGRRALQEERRARKAAERELSALKAAAMTEQERAVAAAKADGLTEAHRATAPRLVRAELRAAAAEAGLSRDALAGFLEYADLGRFIAEDGTPDDKAIAAAVKKLGGSGRTADFDGGARTTAGKPADMNSLIRRSAGLS